MRRFLIVVILGFFGWQTYQHYQVRTAATSALAELPTASVPDALPQSAMAPVAATKVEHHTADSMAEAWKFFELLASRYSCSFGGLEYKESGDDAI